MEARLTRVTHIRAPERRAQGVSEALAILITSTTATTIRRVSPYLRSFANCRRESNPASPRCRVIATMKLEGEFYTRNLNALHRRINWLRVIISARRPVAGKLKLFNLNMHIHQKVRPPLYNFFSPCLRRQIAGNHVRPRVRSLLIVEFNFCTLPVCSIKLIISLIARVAQSYLSLLSLSLASSRASLLVQSRKNESYAWKFIPSYLETEVSSRIVQRHHGRLFHALGGNCSHY